MELSLNNRFAYCQKNKKQKTVSQAQWLMPIIPATQEAEIERMVV
jgi:hypothetical protein